MYLKSLRLENIACFEELDLDFTDENGEPCKWVVLLGENGTGKTSVLDGILGASGLGRLYHKIRINCQVGKALIGLIPTSEDENFSFYRKENIEIGWQFSGNNGQGIGAPSSYLRDISGETSKGYFIGGYGARRKLNLTTDDRDFNSNIHSPKTKRILSLLGSDEKMTPPKVWLSALDYEYIKLENIIKDKPVSIHTLQGRKIVQQYSREEKEKARTKRQIVEKEYRRAITAIESIFPDGTKFVEVTPDKDIVFEENGIHVLIDTLSYGYQSTISWIGDLVRQLCESFPEMENPLAAAGVVLVDEIDLHLHPRWQRMIVQKIRDIFPNIQFIVTSHSPFVAQDMTDKDKIIVLTRDGDKVTARQEKGFVKGWRADQILTSWLFGLETTRDEEIESLEKERRLGLQQDEQKLLTDAERLELDRVTKELEEMRSSDVAPDRQKLEAAAALVMELMSKIL